MILKSIQFSQFADTLEAWHLEQFALGQVNLIVGKNAVGKTRALNIIGNLGNLVSGDQKLIYESGDYQAIFNKDGSVIEYVLGFENTKIFKEKLILDGQILLNRGDKGEGEIFAAELNQRMKFQTPDDELACVARRDSIQHPFFEDLYQWGKSLRHYYFGTQLGKDHLAIVLKGEKEEILNLKQTNLVVGFFKKGVTKYGEVFINSILKEMDLIGYKLDEIGLCPIPHLMPRSPQETHPQGIYVKESDLKGRTYQTDISQGMFRALSLLIQLNFSQLESIPSCILIDDIGEGLDYERSTALINLLIEKSKKSSVQTIMATNDRFVMNNVPLEYWSVFQRIGQTCKVFNYENSKKIFDDFAFTGLGNFDFLRTEFYLKGFDKE
jgi:energy-coupling factor transporter ATP-binding protein EcfA2